jgi:hypothetical protein
LNNADADTRGMARKLLRLGFEVILRLNASRRNFGSYARKLVTVFSVGAFNLFDAVPGFRS